MAIISNSQSFTAAASGNILGSLVGSFKTAIDSVMLGLGRDITIHLPPSKSPCSDITCKYNSSYQRYTGTNGRICETCKGQGFLIENNQTIYIANIRWANEPFNESTRNIEEVFPPGRLGVNFVRTKTVASSLSHIRTSIGATIDGFNVELFQAPRQTGFGDTPLLYAVSWWKVVNR